MAVVTNHFFYISMFITVSTKIHGVRQWQYSILDKVVAIIEYILVFYYL